MVRDAVRGWGLVAAMCGVAFACGARRPGGIPGDAPAVATSTASTASTHIPHAFPASSNTSPLAPAFTQVAAAPGVHIDGGSLGDPVQCVTCHADVVAQWDASAHRSSSFTNRFYAAGVSLTREHRGNKASRWCGGCHDPSLLLDGRGGPGGPGTEGVASTWLDRDDVLASPRAGDGVGCLVCHSTTAASRTGGGGYRVEWRPFVEPDPGSAASVDAHRRAMKPPVVSQSELCATCHKVSLHADVNGKRWYRGQNDFDAWEQGPYAFGGAHTAGAIYAPDVEPKRCQDCHMAREPATKGDLAARLDPAMAGGQQKVIRSHRFLAANTAVAAFAHDAETVAREMKALAGAVRVDVIGVTRGAAFELADRASVAVGEPLMLDVVVENTATGHRFPGGTADSNEVWLDLEVRDAAGVVVARSGALAPNGDLDPDAHRFGVLQLDAAGVPVVQRDAHRFVAVGWDTTIGPRDAQVVRYGVHVPAGAKLPLTATARVLFRKFTAAYAALACRIKGALSVVSKACPPLPVAEVARDASLLGASPVASRATDATAANRPVLWRRLDAYARGLLQARQEDVGTAGPVLAEVVRLAPDRADGYIDLARLAIREGRTGDALAQLDRAERIDPVTPVVPYLRGVAAYDVYKLGDAVAPLRVAVAGAPKNVHAAELLAEALELRGDDRGALDVVHTALEIDPESAQLRHLEALAYDRLGLPADAEVARGEYLRYRADDDRPRLRAACKAKVPGCAREATPLHVHWISTVSSR